MAHLTYPTLDPAKMLEKATAHVVKMLDGTDGERWNGANPMYQGVCGWCGVMAPMNRPAFVAKFGEDFTKKVEELARKTLADRANFWENSKAKGYEAMADNAESNDPASFEVGGFVWGIMDTLKCDHENLRRVVRHLIEEKAESKSGVLEARLCRIIRIEEVEDIERDAATILKGWKAQSDEGGTASDDVSDEEFGKFGQNYSQLTAEQKRTFYTLAVLIRDKQGKYFLIDPEGYEYPRYVILPKRWEHIFYKTTEEVGAEIVAEEEAEAKAKAEAEAAARAAYDARCEKWAGMMEELPAEAKGHEYLPEYRKVGKRNVLKMAKAVFPWVRFSVSYDRGWGSGYVLKWKNGPSVEEVEKACDFGLFEPWWDTFDGMTDYADTASAKFTDFSDKFGGVGNGVKCEREECEKDQNGDPNGKPPKPSKPPKGNGNGGDSVEVRENKEKGGLEIHFPSMPSEAIRDFMKSRNWRWSKFSRCWWHKATDEARNTAAEVVAMWEKENGRAAA